MNDIIKSIEEAQLKSDITPFSVGDTIKVYAKVKEGNRERTQVFEGTVIKRQNGSNRETFTVRKSRYLAGWSDHCHCAWYICSSRFWDQDGDH